MGTFLIKSTQFDPIFMKRFLFRWEILKLISTLESRNRSGFLHHFSFHSWRVHFDYSLANENEMKSKKSHIPKVIYMCILSMNNLLLLL